MSNPKADLPIGAYVYVTEFRLRGERDSRTYYARVVGYDLSRSKYQVGRRYPGWGKWLFGDGGTWVFPGEVREVTEAQATALPEKG